MYREDLGGALQHRPATFESRSRHTVCTSRSPPCSTGAPASHPKSSTGCEAPCSGRITSRVRPASDGGMNICGARRRNHLASRYSQPFPLEISLPRAISASRCRLSNNSPCTGHAKVPHAIQRPDSFLVAVHARHFLYPLPEYAAMPSPARSAAYGPAPSS
jgi:hypothetical protein